MLNLFNQVTQWRREKYFRNNELEFHWNHIHISIVGDYFSILSKFDLHISTCDFRELPSAKLLINDYFWKFDPKIVASFTQELEELFIVPKLNKFHESQNRIKKYQLVEVFISFLLQLLYHKTDSIVNPCKDGIDNLEKELRFLLTILGDISWMLCDNDEHEEFQNLLAEFEAVANEAGILVHSLFFSIDRVFEKMDEGLALVLNNMDLLNGNIMKFLSLLSSNSISAFGTPKTCVVDSLLIVDSLINHLEDLMKQEDNRIADVKDQIKLLHQGLILSQSSVKDIKSPQPSELKEPLIRIGDMAHQAEYLIISFLVRDAPLWYLINRLTDVNHKIELIRTDLQVITKKYQFGGLKVAKYFGAQLSLQDETNTEVNDVTVGFEDNATDILHQLVRRTERLQIISILGMPGIGKTTLAKKLYNHPSVNYRFDKQSWYVVSQKYHKQSMLTNILIHVNSELDKDRVLEMEEETLVEHVYKTLKGRRYLIVMDDIWDLNVWDDLQRYFPDDGNGSRILLTSRNKDVAPPNSIIHELPFLLDEQCWELLEKKVFGIRPCPPELQGIGKKIAAKCCGLPLTVVIIAGILSTVDREKSTWEEVGGNLASYIDGGDNSVMQILELSYKHLPDHLKPCFLYFGAFEEDKELSVRKLMRLWIAEGFICKEKERNAENVAEEYLVELIDKNLVMVAKRRSDGGVKACVIHDLLRDLCFKICEEENFLKFEMSNYYSMHEKGHRLRVLENSVHLSLRQHVHLSHCQHVRSFYAGNMTSPFYVRDMRLLRVYHFDYIYPSHITGIEYLVSLRYLVIGDFPTSIDKLVNLEYLHVGMSVYLTPAIMKMKKLRYIYTDSGAIYDRHCNSSNTNNLEFLSWVSIVEFKDEEMLKCSPHLRKLKCRYELRPMEERAYPQFDLRFLTQLDSLNLTFRRYQYSFVLEEFRFPSNIRKLTLSESRLPWEKMSIIGRLENLEVLKLGDNAFEGERWDTRDGEFQKLKFLKLEEIFSLTQWGVVSSEHFPKLQLLILSNCKNLQEIPSEIGEITTLQLIEVKEECRKSAAESAKRIQQEQWDMGNEELRVITSTTYYTWPNF